MGGVMFDDFGQIILANILSQGYLGLPLSTVIQHFHVTHLILMLSKMELGIHIFYSPKYISNHMEMIWAAGRLFVLFDEGFTVSTSTSARVHTQSGRGTCRMAPQLWGHTGTSNSVSC